MDWIRNWLGNIDETDPVVRAYRRLFQKLVGFAVLGLVVAALAFVAGVPHLQTSYSYRGPTPSNGIVKSWQKIDANYIGPFGWQRARNGQYCEGCPILLLIPLFDCFD